MSLNSAATDFYIRDSGLDLGFVQRLSQVAPRSTLEYLNRLSALSPSSSPVDQLPDIGADLNEAALVQAYYGAVVARLEAELPQVKANTTAQKKQYFTLLMQLARRFKQRFGLEKAQFKSGCYEYTPIGFLDPEQDYSRLCPGICKKLSTSLSSLDSAKTFSDLLAFVEPLGSGSKVSDYLLLEQKREGESEFVITAGGRDWITSLLRFDFSDEELECVDLPKAIGQVDETYRHKIADLDACQTALDSLIESFTAEQPRLSDLNPAQLDKLDAFILDALGLDSVEQLSKYLSYMSICYQAFKSQEFKAEGFFENFRHNFLQLLFKDQRVLNPGKGAKSSLELRSPLIMDRLYSLMSEQDSLGAIHEFWVKVFPKIASDVYAQDNYGFTTKLNMAQNPKELKDFMAQLYEFIQAQKSYYQSGENPEFFAATTAALELDAVKLDQLCEPVLQTQAGQSLAPDQQVLRKYKFAKFLRDFDLSYFDSLKIQARHDLAASILSSCILLNHAMQVKHVRTATKAEQAIVPRLQAIAQALIEEFTIFSLPDGRSLCFLPLASAQGLIEQDTDSKKEWQLFWFSPNEFGFELESLVKNIKLLQSGPNCRNLDLITNFSFEDLKEARSSLEIIFNRLDQDGFEFDTQAFRQKLSQLILRICDGHPELRASLTYGRPADIIDSNIIFLASDLNLLPVNQVQDPHTFRIEGGIQELVLLIGRHGLLDEILQSEKFFRGFAAGKKDQFEEGFYQERSLGCREIRSLAAIRRAESLSLERQASLLRFYAKLQGLASEKVVLDSELVPIQVGMDVTRVSKYPNIYQRMLGDFADLLNQAQCSNKELPVDFVDELCGFVADLNLTIEQDPENLLLLTNLFKAKILDEKIEAMSKAMQTSLVLAEASKDRIPAGSFSAVSTAAGSSNHLLEEDIYLELLAKPRTAKASLRSKDSVTWERMLHLQKSCAAIKPDSKVESNSRAEFLLRRLLDGEQTTENLIKSHFYRDQEANPIKICAHCIDRTLAKLSYVKDSSDYWQIVSVG